MDINPFCYDLPRSDQERSLAMEISKKVYIKGKDAQTRIQNLLNLAKEHYRGNFSEMVNDCLNKRYHLDPTTGEPRRKA